MTGVYFFSIKADALHAYKVVRAHGVPKEQIIVMVYDDIAYNQRFVGFNLLLQSQFSVSFGCFFSEIRFRAISLTSHKDKTSTTSIS